MQRLFLLIYTYRTFLVFTGLQIICLWLIVNNNPYQSASFFNTSNHVAGQVLEKKGNILDYFKLKDINHHLVMENASLREELLRKTPVALNENDSIANISWFTGINENLIDQYELIPAKVISNSTRMFKNHLTLNKGWMDGVAPGMGVITGTGVIGRVKSVSKHFSTVVSLLHIDMGISSILTSAGTFGTIRWTGADPGIATLMYIPRHINVQIGDTVTTSGYNTVFPPDILIGTVKEIRLMPNSNFYDLDIGLALDFSALSHAFVVRNHFQEELDSLRTASIPILNE
jgi:rod shape-determining protein MreC